MVSVPNMVAVGEESGMVEVCIILFAEGATEREFVVTLTTSDYTGKNVCGSQFLEILYDHF